MRVLYTVLLLLIGSINSCFSQCPSWIQFRSQSEVDAFATNYPGCTAIPGDVSINRNVYNLLGLSNLTSIGGNLTITMSWLSNLNGLENLSSISGSLYIANGYGNLNDITGLRNLKTLGGLNIEFEPSLTNLDGLENIKTLQGLWFDDVPLSNLKGLKNVQTISGNVTIFRTNIASLKDLENLSLLDIPYNNGGGWVMLSDNSKLKECATKPVCNALETVQQVSFFNNAIGCNSKAEVQAQCLLLPVTLVSFKAINENGNVVLSWLTSEEKNSELYEIQRSRDGKSWSTIGKVHAAGESNEVRHYTYTDINTMYGENLYRLKMVDLDGSFAYSRIISVTSNKLAEVVPYPNPITENRFFLKPDDLSKASDIRIFNNSGRLLYESQKFPASGIDTKNFPSGQLIFKYNIQSQKGDEYRIIKQ